ncbi:virion structural protein [Pseudomonas phage Psa21]|uniref:Virion structural protein n=1 Tax=Pseudomonas phage Psa21 TaxID=2530023 RepID=A0A481W5V2_9CAUD|nr:virion structural protein [Pseudomonas phage Psa21]QBJ02637.1 virion structural protein [Pseudomonas phage Psa21]
MNILNYLTPTFEDFVDAPVGADQLAHNATAPAGEPGIAPVAETTPDSLEIPESVGPALVATSDEVQAAAVVEDAAHNEAAQAAEQATAADTAVIEQAAVAPAEASAAATDTPAEGTTDVPEQTDASAGTTDLGGSGDDGGTAGDELGGDAGDSGTGTDDAGSTSDLGDDAPLESETDLGEAGAETSEVTEEPAATEETTAEEIPAEDGLGETEGEEGEEDGLGDGAESGAETGEAQSETEEESTEETETEETGSEATGEEESGESEGESETSEEEETEAGSEETDSAEDDGVDIDIPDVDVETDEDDVAEAEEEAAEALAEDEELEDEIVDTSKSVDELDEDTASVEEFIGVLQHGIRTKRFNAQTVALAQSKLQKLSGKWQSESPVIPSMEDYSEQNLAEYYTNSLESFSSFLKKIKHVRDQFLDNFAKKMNDKIHLKAVETEIAAINKALDVQIVRIKGLELTEAATVKVPAPLRGEGGPVKAVTAELQWLGEVANVFSHDKKWFEGVAGLLATAVKEGDALKSTATINKALKLPLPVKSYPAGVFSGSQLTTFNFEKSDKKATGSMAEDMASLADRAIPEANGHAVATGKGPETVTLKKTDLVKMLQLAKVLIGLSRGTAGAAGKGIVDTIDIVNRSKSELNQKDAKTGDAPTRAANEKALDKLVTQFWVGLHHSTENYSHFQWHIVTLADNLVHLVKKVK